MANQNIYATLAEYKAFVTARGQTFTTDATDDSVIADLLESASRFLDEKTTRQFYPSIQSRAYDLPVDGVLYLDGDLLEVITLTNGDGSAIASNQYNFKSPNRSPYWGIALKQLSTTSWEASSTNGSEQAITVNGWWGYHNNYSSRGWLQVGTLSAAVTDTTTLAFSATTGHAITAGMVLKIDSEVYNIDTAATNTITPVKRGDNGSTAATHLISAPIYKWQPMPSAKEAVLEITSQAYKRRFGQSGDSSTTFTAAGVIITSRDVPTMAQEFIKSFQVL